MEAKNILIAFVIGAAVVVILIAFYTRGFTQLGETEKGFFNKTIEDPYAVTGESVRVYTEEEHNNKVRKVCEEILGKISYSKNL